MRKGQVDVPALSVTSLRSEAARWMGEDLVVSAFLYSRLGDDCL